MLNGFASNKSTGKCFASALIWLGLICSGSSGLFAQAQVYFSSAYGLTGTPLKTELEGIIDGHTTLSYTPGVWEAHKDLYEDPNNPANLILFYSQASISKANQDNGSSPSDYFNREHLWPRSYGVGSSGSDNTDLFHLVPAYKGVNSSRGNKYFDYSSQADGSFSDPAHPLAPECTSDSNSWEPADAQKGWVARAMFYMTTRYNYLSLVDTSQGTTSASMAELSTLLEWNRKFLPSEKELDVNQRIFDNYQGNRNPYIDFPEFADAVFVTGPSWGGWRLQHFSLVELLDPVISGDLADPDGDGLSNLLEMARYSDPRNEDTVPALEFHEDEPNLTISFIRATDANNLNMVIQLEESGDMVSWSPISIESATTTSINPNSEKVSLIIQPAGITSRFYRLRVER